MSRRVVITGSTKLAKVIADTFSATPVNGQSHTVDCVRVEQPIDWNEYDIFINHAHVGFCQTELLWSAFQAWKNDESKYIVNISSRAAKPNISKGYLYAAQKAALNHLSDNLVYNSDKKCRITTLNLGLLENKDGIPSVSYQNVMNAIWWCVMNYPQMDVPEITIQAPESYVSVQEEKEMFRDYPFLRNGDTIKV